MTRLSTAQDKALRNAASAFRQHRVMGYSDYGVDGAADLGPGGGVRIATITALVSRGLVTTERLGLLDLYRLTDAGWTALGHTPPKVSE